MPSFDTWFSGLFIHNGATQTDTINPLATSSSLRVDGDFVPASLDSPAQPLPATAEDIFAQLDDDQDGFVTGDSVLTWWASVTEPGSHRAQFMQRVFDENGIEAQQDMESIEFECLLEELHELESETAAEQPPTFEQWCVGLYQVPPGGPASLELAQTTHSISSDSSCRTLDLTSGDFDRLTDDGLVEVAKLWPDTTALFLGQNSKVTTEGFSKFENHCRSRGYYPRVCALGREVSRESLLQLLQQYIIFL